MLARTKSVIGLDIGTSSVKAVELSHSGRDVELVAVGKIELEDQDPATQARAVKDLLASGGFHTRRVVTAVSGKQVVVSHLTMMRMSDEELRNTIAFEAEKYVPFPVEDCVIDCQRLDAPGDDKKSASMSVLMVAAARSKLDEHLGILAGANVVPEAIDIDCFALANGVELCRNIDPAIVPGDPVLAMVDIGLVKTTICITDRGVPMFTRELAIGGKEFTEAIARQLNVSEEEAENQKRLLDNQSEELRNAVFTAIEDLGNEIQLSLDYFQKQFQKSVGRVLLSGGGSRLGLAREAMERIFERPVTAFDPFSCIRVREGIDRDLLGCTASQLVVAVGLAARGHRG
jgi:type IV pilus assembly protein PilM